MNQDVTETVLGTLYDTLEEFLIFPEGARNLPGDLKRAITAAFSHGAISETHAAYLVRRFGLESV